MYVINLYVAGAISGPPAPHKKQILLIKVLSNVAV